MSRVIYVASSWKNDFLDPLFAALQKRKHKPYDFRTGPSFNWETLHDPPTAKNYASALYRKIATEAYISDFEAMRAAEVAILVLPAGNSAHAEFGWFAGRGIPVFVYLPDGIDGYEWRPDLMHRLGGRVPVLGLEALLEAVDALR